MPSSAAVLPFVLLAVLAKLCQIRAAIDCFSCASSALHNEWQVTGLPEMPPTDRFSFHECDGTGNDIIKPCDDVCMEMLVVVGNEYGVVRGCMSDFYRGYSVLTPRDDKCYFGQYAQNVTIYDHKTGSAKTYNQLYVGVHYCSTPEKNEHACNNKLVASKEAAEGDGPFAESFCRQTQQMPTTECLSCSRYDSTGNCNSNWRQTCQGQWCTKTTGHVNGRWIESRGCAPFSPSGNSICVRMESEHSFDLFDSNSLKMPYSLERCFCQGAHCNGAIRSMGANLVPIWCAALFALLGVVGEKLAK